MRPTLHSRPAISRLNPFMNQVYFYKHEGKLYGMAMYAVLIPL